MGTVLKGMKLAVYITNTKTMKAEKATRQKIYPERRERLEFRH